MDGLFGDLNDHEELIDAQIVGKNILDECGETDGRYDEAIHGCDPSPSKYHSQETHTTEPEAQSRVRLHGRQRCRDLRKDRTVAIPPIQHDEPEQAAAATGHEHDELGPTRTCVPRFHALPHHALICNSEIARGPK